MNDFIWTKGSKILLLGAGGVGISAAVVLKDFYLADITVSDFLPYRLQKAAELGLKTIRSEDLDCSYDVVIDCAGSDPASKNAALIEGVDYLKPNMYLNTVISHMHISGFWDLEKSALCETVLYEVI